jgi:hypothetical protein
MEHVQEYVAFYKEQDRKSSLKYIGLISLMPVVIASVLICAFSFDDVTIAEQNSIEAKQLSVRPDAQRNRKKAPIQSLEGLSAQDKKVLFFYAAFGKSLRPFGNDKQKHEDKRNSQ